MARKYRRLGGNLVGAIRLALPLPASRRLFYFDLDQIFMLLFLGFAADILCGYLEAGANPRFWNLGWASEAIGTLATLIASYVAARLARAPQVAPALMMLMLAGGLVLDVPEAAAALLWGGNGNPEAVFVGYSVLVYTIWFALYGIRSLRLLLPQRRWPVVLLGLLVVLGPLAPTGFGISYPFWYTPPQSADEDDGPLVDVEQVYSAQPGLMQNALGAIKPHQPGESSLYFLGFASWANQDVFLKEARFAQYLFDDKFGTADRSLLLVDNPATVDKLPLASVSNLRAALDGLAGKMDRDQDVLVLFLTSHGSPGHLAVRFDRFELDGLSAVELRRLLDQAGIKWRVIVVSACYSGSFVESLKDDNTLVMTAARKDRTSFGCGNENDFTYFGEAYFGHALQQTYSFTTAFDAARTSIAAREGKEGLTPSEPQIFVGAAIGPKLDEIQAHLERPATP
ncbi:MAG: C13 family peptidase [Aliidongia sp.]